MLKSASPLPPLRSLPQPRNQGHLLHLRFGSLDLHRRGVWSRPPLSDGAGVASSTGARARGGAGRPRNRPALPRYRARAHGGASRPAVAPVATSPLLVLRGHRWLLPARGHHTMSSWWLPSLHCPSTSPLSGWRRNIFCVRACWPQDRMKRMVVVVQGCFRCCIIAMAGRYVSAIPASVLYRFL